MSKHFFLPLILTAFISSCSLIGFHYNIHNPSRPGKYPKLTEERVLLGNQESKFRTCYDVTYYYLSVHFGADLEKDKSIRGNSAMNAVALVDFDTLQIDLAENMKISAIHSGHASPTGKGADDELKYFRKKRAAFVVFPQKIKKGQSFGILVDYSGKPQEAERPPWRGGFVRKKDDLKNHWWGVACQTEGASIWWPCKDVVNDEPDSVDVDLYVPEGYTGVSNGTRVLPMKRMFSGPPGLKASNVFCWHIANPINIYDVTFYIGKYKLLHDNYYSKITKDTLQLNHYVLEQHYERAKEHFGQVKDHLAFYEQTFGPYPWYDDSYKLVESPYAGMEHQSGIAYGNGFKNHLQYNFDYIILHETAHEWWGNAVTATDLADGWLHEGFATYAEALYVEKTSGYHSYLYYLQFYRFSMINRRPLVAPYGMRYFNYKDGDIYVKGAWVLHSLRYSLNNDTLFFDILKSFYMKFRYKNATSYDFQTLVNEKSKSDYTWFFDAYLRNRFVPELEYAIHGDQLYYRWIKAPDNFSMKLSVTTTGGKRLQLEPVTNTVKIISLGSATELIFDESKFLYKPVESKRVRK